MNSNHGNSFLFQKERIIYIYWFFEVRVTFPLQPLDHSKCCVWRVLCFSYMLKTSFVDFVKRNRAQMVAATTVFYLYHPCPAFHPFPMPVKSCARCILALHNYTPTHREGAILQSPCLSVRPFTLS